MAKLIGYIAVIEALPNNILFGGFTTHESSIFQSRDDAGNFAEVVRNTNNQAGRKCISKIIVVSKPWEISTYKGN